MNLLVSFHTEADQRKIFNEGLNGDYNISYLEDAANRSEAIKNADVILAWNPRLEFSPEEYPLFSHVRLMQLFSAGVTTFRMSYSR